MAGLKPKSPTPLDPGLYLDVFVTNHANIKTLHHAHVAWNNVYLWKKENKLKKKKKEFYK